MTFLQLDTSTDVRRVLAFAWRLWTMDRLPQLQAWQAFLRTPAGRRSLPYTSRVMRAGPPTAFDWSNPARAWVWQTVACPRLTVVPVSPGALIIEQGRGGGIGTIQAWVDGNGPSIQLPTDADLLALEGVTNIPASERPSIAGARARIALGLPVPGVPGINLTARAFNLGASDLRGRAALTGRFLAAQQAREAEANTLP